MFVLLWSLKHLEFYCFLYLSLYFFYFFVLNCFIWIFIKVDLTVKTLRGSFKIKELTYFPVVKEIINRTSAFLCVFEAVQKYCHIKNWANNWNASRSTTSPENIRDNFIVGSASLRTVCAQLHAHITQYEWGTQWSSTSKWLRAVRWRQTFLM